jgi:DNA-binding transcriptional MerR regulator
MTTDKRSGAGRRVGELAAATGLTVRTLHYYGEIGLLVASNRTDAGHRLYADADVERLYRICLLRRLGLPLGEIARALDDPEWELRSAMAVHLRDLERRLDATAQLRGRLAQLVGAMQITAGPPAADLLEVLEEMTMLDSTVQRRISILVYADLQAAFDYLERVFGLGPGELTRDGEGTSSTARSKRATGWCGCIPRRRSSDCCRPGRWGARRRAWRSWSTTSTRTTATPRSKARRSTTNPSTNRTATASTARATAKAVSGRS